MTPKTRTVTGVRSDGATEVATLAAPIATPSEMAIRTLVQRSRLRPPLASNHRKLLSCRNVRSHHRHRPLTRSADTTASEV
jgi:hypothetical protein